MKKQNLKFIKIVETKNNNWNIIRLRDNKKLATVYDLSLAVHVAWDIEDFYCRLDKKLK